MSGPTANLCLDGTGNVYLLTDFTRWVGRSFTEGLHNLLLGYKGWTLQDWVEPPPTVPVWWYNDQPIAAADVATAPIGPPLPGHPFFPGVRFS